MLTHRPSRPVFDALRAHGPQVELVRRYARILGSAPAEALRAHQPHAPHYKRFDTPAAARGRRRD